MNKYKSKEIIAVVMVVAAVVATALVTNIITGLESQGEIKRLQIELDNSNKEVLELQEENNRLQNRLSLSDNVEELEKQQKEAEKLKNDLDKAEGVINSLKSKIKRLEGSSQAQYGTELGHEEVFVQLDDDSVSNLITAVYLLNGTTIKSGRSLSVKGVIGTLGDYNYIDNKVGYALGTENVTDTLYKASLKSDLQIMEYKTNSQGYIFVNDSSDLVIRNNTSSELVIKCGYSKGTISVSIFKC